MIIRQGDVLLVKVEKIPAGAVPVAPKASKVILAFGEVTGHHHRFEFVDTSESVRMFQAGAERYIHVTEPADLLHEEHSTARVPPGYWLLPVQMEYTPAQLRRVAD